MKHETLLKILFALAAIVILGTAAYVQMHPDKTGTATTMEVLGHN